MLRSIDVLGQYIIIYFVLARDVEIPKQFTNQVALTANDLISNLNNLYIFKSYSHYPQSPDSSKVPQYLGVKGIPPKATGTCSRCTNILEERIDP